jgi:hypothetical protein
MADSVELRSLSTEEDELSSVTEDTVNDGEDLGLSDDDVGSARMVDDGTSI